MCKGAVELCPHRLAQISCRRRSFVGDGSGKSRISSRRPVGRCREGSAAGTWQ